MMTRGTLTSLTINGVPVEARVVEWDAEELLPFTPPPVVYSAPDWTFSFTFHQTRRQAIATRRLFRLPTSLHRRERRRARKRRH
jgi:hypothetical protein